MKFAVGQSVGSLLQYADPTVNGSLLPSANAMLKPQQTSLSCRFGWLELFQLFQGKLKAILLVAMPIVLGSLEELHVTVSKSSRKHGFGIHS